MAELRRTVYSAELQKQIFPDNSFYKKSVSEKGVADDAETVEKPVQGKSNEAKEGEPESYPIQIEVATDSKKTYPVTLLYAKPILITSQSQLLTNYSKRQTKQEQQASEINTKAADYTAYHWAPTQKANILRTSGDARVSNILGMTSKRKAFTKDLMLQIQNLMIRMNVSSLPGNWYGMLTADSYTDLMTIPEFVDYYKTGNTSKLESGIIGRILGVEIYTRATESGHTGLLYKADGTPVKANSKITDDLLAANLFWHEKMVCHAEGKLNVSINEGAPGYLGGTTIESYVRFGADIIREDQKGVIAVLESK